MSMSTLLNVLNSTQTSSQSLVLTADKDFSHETLNHHSLWALLSCVLSVCFKQICFWYGFGFPACEVFSGERGWSSANCGFISLI